MCGARIFMRRARLLYNRTLLWKVLGWRGRPRTTHRSCHTVECNVIEPLDNAMLIAFELPDKLLHYWCSVCVCERESVVIVVVLVSTSRQFFPPSLDNSQRFGRRRGNRRSIALTHATHLRIAIFGNQENYGQTARII